MTRNNGFVLRVSSESFYAEGVLFLQRQQSSNVFSKS